VAGQALKFSPVTPCVFVFFAMKRRNRIMTVMNNLGSKGRASIVAMGILFITLGVSLQSESSWLFTLGGVAMLLQGLYEQIQNKSSNKKESK
jgi:hypothetical protein